MVKDNDLVQSGIPLNKDEINAEFSIIWLDRATKKKDQSSGGDIALQEEVKLVEKEKREKISKLIEGELKKIFAGKEEVIVKCEITDEEDALEVKVKQNENLATLLRCPPLVCEVLKPGLLLPPPDQAPIQLALTPEEGPSPACQNDPGNVRGAALSLEKHPTMRAEEASLVFALKAVHPADKVKAKTSLQPGIAATSGKVVDPAAESSQTSVLPRPDIDIYFNSFSASPHPTHLNECTRIHTNPPGANIRFQASAVTHERQDAPCIYAYSNCEWTDGLCGLDCSLGRYMRLATSVTTQQRKRPWSSSWSSSTRR
jgi:hypothetical protein